MKTKTVFTHHTVYDWKFLFCVKVLNDAFYDLEYVCIGYGINLSGTEDVRRELSMLVKETTKDGVSLLAREIKSNQIVGFSFNKLQVKDHCLTHPKGFF